jgi:ATP-dependent Lon protease
MADAAGNKGKPIEIAGELAVLPLRNSVLFPGAIMPIDVARPRSVVALERAGANGVLALVAQKDKDEDGPDIKLFDVGCAVRILKIIRLSKDHQTVIIQGLQRIRILDLDRSGACFVARVDQIVEPDGLDDDLVLQKAKMLRVEAHRLIGQMPALPKEASGLVDQIAHPGVLADMLVGHLDLSVEEKQQVLETIPLAQRVDLALAHVKRAAGA